MKHRIVFIIIALLLIATFSKPVRAAEPVSDASAALSFGKIARDTRVDMLTAYLNAYNSPLTAESKHFIAEADRLHLDWRLVAAISGVESTFGKNIPPRSYNAWGWGIPTGTQSGLAFTSWKEGITAVSEGLRYNYFDRGLQTIEQVGRVYAASPRWAGNVRYFLNNIDAFTPTDPDLLEVIL
ncbi:glucosaminidase domain-containing protein [Patescibacteria group bacterium]|nr:glucosaminidase domain-containing protein [Patescibacteria group bacterium]MBU2460146.1 glucosaminidase domain-containing protein [Patescibacteria group bacterium]MBU2544429.1 glucosaminidase domain-containing protein [Patescibacteria group bacterium]